MGVAAICCGRVLPKNRKKSSIIVEALNVCLHSRNLTASATKYNVYVIFDLLKVLHSKFKLRKPSCM